MNRDLDAIRRIPDLSPGEFELFRSALGVLTSKTFIIRGIDRERELYDFVLRNSGLFEAWFACMDAELVRDESLGVIAFRGPGKNRLHFSRDEICAALTLRLLYEEKKRELSLAGFPAVSIGDFQQKYKALTGEEIRKTVLIAVMRRLASCKLISGDYQGYADPESLIRLYPSIPLSIDREALDGALAFLGRGETGGGEEGDPPVPEDAGDG